MAKYSKASQQSVEDAMHEMKKGKLKSGKSGKKLPILNKLLQLGFQKLVIKGLKYPKRLH